jgi:acylpyruvate hydrolase
MKLITFSAPNETLQRFGVLIAGYAVDLPVARVLWRTSSRAAPEAIATSVQEALVSANLEAVSRVANYAAANLENIAMAGAAYPEEQITFYPPIQKPGKILCVGVNYTAHIKEMGRELPKYPVIFSKFNNVLTGHRQKVPMPQISEMVDYEAELAVIIGRRAKDVPESEALYYVGGYAPFNDITVRDVQNRTSQWLLGKSFDGCGPFGPAVVTPDEIDNPQALNIRLLLNGQTMQDANTDDLFFKIPFLISYISQMMTLEPGDIISTGTPGGVGFARNPQVFLKPGDMVQVEIQQVGTLENTVA